jgi:hypothetical protein
VLIANAVGRSALILCLTAAGSALAGTSVSGPITSNTIWTLANAPYTVTADVTVDSGAVLTIEAGVTVHLNAATNLIIKNGALTALGTAAAPIVFTSYRDIANPNPSPAPGDWGHLQFRAGTLSSATSLNHVQVRYGSGIALTAASPTLNNINIVNNNGPAIAIDLQSSPVGSGLSATGNTLNGILVPAGDITGTVRWALTGIPYVVAQGIVGIGTPTISISPTALTLDRGTSGTLHITISSPAPTGGLAIALASSAPAVVSVPASIVVPENATSVDLTVNALAVGTTTITASRAGMGSAGATVQVNGPLTVSVVPSPIALLPDGINHKYTLTVSNTAPTNRVFSLVAADPAVLRVAASSVTIPAGALQADFSLAGLTTGATQLLVTAPGAADAIAFTAVVGTDTAAVNVSRSVVLGVVKGDPTAVPGGTQLRAYSTAVGVAKGDPTTVPAGTQLQTYSTTVGVAKGDPISPPAGQQLGPVVARPVGVNRP